MPNILFQDQRFIVLDKPPGLPVHAGPSGGPSVEDWFPQFSRRKDGPWLVHRLDADTAGCLVIALRRAALHAAQTVFAEGRAEKLYWAIVQGGPPEETGAIDQPLLKISNKSGWRMHPNPAGQSARTEWQVLGRANGLAWLALRPKTGRTHQIRAHCRALGCPILGDPVYGQGQGPLHLLARAITLPLDPVLAATAQPPNHMETALAACGYRPTP